MATSGSYDFTVTRDQLIDLAHQHIGAIGEGESASTSQVTEAARLLNMIVKLRAADGMPLWAMKRGTVLPFTGANAINTNSHVVTFYDSTTVSTSAAISATSLVLTAIGTIANGDAIGIELDDGTMQWTTVNGVPSGTTVVLTTGLTAAATAGNRVYAYTASTDRVQRPLRIMAANRLTVASGTRTPIDIEDREDYYALSNLTTASVPNLIFYDVALGTNVADPATATTWYGTINVWPRFSSGDDVVEFSYQRPFQDFDASTDNPDFPQEFYLPLMMELASLLGPKFGVSPQERAALFKEAQFYLMQALATVEPEGSISIQPNQE